MKIIIYGATETGYLVASELFEKHDITIIDIHESLPDEFHKLDISFVSGNGSNVNVLDAASIKDADIFIACSNLDEANIVSCWTAKKISGIETVCFVSNMEHFESLVSPTQSMYQTEFDINYVIWPEELLKQEIFRIITVPEALDVEYFAGGKAQLFEYKIKDDSLILNKKIFECTFPENTLIVGIKREDELFIPDGNTQLKQADKVIFMGTEQGLNIIARNFFQRQSKINTAGIIGGGSVGYMLAESLEKIGIKTKLIEANEQRCEYLADNLKNTLVLNGDGTSLELLESEEFGDMDVVVSVTNNDEKNLLCSLLVKQLGVKRVITRVGNARNVDLFEKVGIDVGVSPMESAIKDLRNRIIERDIDILALVERGQGEVIEVTTPKGFSDIAIMDIKSPAKAIIGAIKRGHKVIIPKGNTLIREDDKLIIFTMSDDAQIVKEYFIK